MYRWWLLLLLGCDEPVAVHGSTASSSIVRAPDGTLWVASPDDDRIAQIDPSDLKQLTAVSVTGRPVALALADDGRLLVALAQGSEVVRFDPQFKIQEHLPLPCGGLSAVVAQGNTAWVTCPWDERVVEVDLEAWRVRRVLRVAGRPEALAMGGGKLAVGASAPGLLMVIEGEDPQRLETTPGFAANRVLAAVWDGHRFRVSFQRVDHDSDRSRAPEAGGYGRVVDGQPRIEPRLSGCASYAVFDGGERVFSGPRALASAGGLTWVVHEFTNNVAVLDCAKNPSLIKSFRVGRGPRGITLSPDGRTAFVDVGFDHAVARLDLDTGEVFARTRETGTRYLSPAAERGRSLFSDATNTHLTPSGVISCATCHPDGGEDGLSWFLHTPEIPAKLRRTPPAWAGRPELAPFHWDGQFSDAAELSLATLRSLMEGDGLLVDTTAIAAWMAAIEPPPGRPASDPEDAALIAQGAEVFEQSCAECHPPPLYSDGRRHRLPPTGADPLAALEAVDTPSLRGVRARAPFLHTGQAQRLSDLLTLHFAADRTQRATEALLRFLESL